MKKILLAAIMAFTMTAANEAKADDYPSNWSIDVQGGITSGFLTFGSKTTAQGGLRVRYSMNPVVSFYGDLSGGQFRSLDSMQGQNGFENNYFTIGLGTRMNLLRMLTGLNSATEQFGLYATTGIGLMRGYLSVCDENYSGYVGRDNPVNAVVYRISSGATYRINRRVDIFVQAGFNHSSSDFLDGYQPVAGGSTGRFSGGDSYLNTSAGITFKFGRSQSHHVDWQPYDHRANPLAHSLRSDIVRLETELEESEQARDQLAQRMLSMSQTLNEFSHLINTAHKEEFKTFDNQVESLQNRMDLIQSNIDDLSDQADVRRPEPTDEQFYVVASVFRNRDNAERALRRVVNDGFDQASIQQDTRRNYYLVAYSGHPTREQALQEMRRIRDDINPDSWVYVR
ncbi:MAG: outer membrane beta-barrel protein [Cyclonatronaceae bacterium]